MLKLLYLFPFFLLTLVKTDTTNSPGCKKTFDPPQDKSTVTWEPYNFPNGDPPQLPYNYTCEYQINVPSSWYAEIQLTVSTVSGDNTSSVQIIDQLSGTQNVHTAPTVPYYFISPGGKIVVSTRSNVVKFGFRIIWNQYPSTPARMSVGSEDMEPKIITINTSENNLIVVTSSDRIDVTVMPPNPTDIYMNGLSGTLFFDGPDTNSTCLGNGWQLLNNTKTTTTNHTLTIVFLGHAYDSINLHVLVQQRIAVLTEYRGITCQDASKCGTFVMDATNGQTVALQTYDDGTSRNYIINRFDGTGTLEVYNGRITPHKTNRIASYDLSNSLSMFPQMFPGKFNTFVLTGGLAMINFIRSTSQIQQIQKIGESGYIFSNDYGLNTKNQDSYLLMKAPNGTDSVKFRVQIEAAYLDTYKKLQISVSKNSSRVDQMSYSGSNKPTLCTDMVMYGDTMVVEYTASGDQSTGFYMKYTVENLSSGFGFLSLLVFMLFRLL